VKRTLPAVVDRDQYIPQTVPEAQRALAKLEHDIDSEQTYAAIRRIERQAEAIKKLFAELDDVRQQAERVIVLANYRIGEEITAAPVATGTRGQLVGRDASGASRRDAPESAPSLKDQVGSQKRGLRLKKLASIPKNDVIRRVADLHAEDREATVTAVLKIFTDEKKYADRLAALARRTKIETAGRYTIVKQDALAFLAAIEPRSIELLLTDPPYSTDVPDIDAFCRAWLPPALRCLKPSGRAYIFTGAYAAELEAYSRELRALAASMRWTLDSAPLVWTYRNRTTDPTRRHSIARVPRQIIRIFPSSSQCMRSTSLIRGTGLCFTAFKSRMSWPSDSCVTARSRATPSSIRFAGPARS
jgi:hypothetical protein